MSRTEKLYFDIKHSPSCSCSWENGLDGRSHIQSSTAHQRTCQTQLRDVSFPLTCLLPSVPPNEVKGLYGSIHFAVERKSASSRYAKIVW